jgi:peroxidase
MPNTARFVQSGGPFFPVELGRLDGMRSSASNVAGKLPQPNNTLSELVAIFKSNGLNMSDMVALSGAT